MADRRQGLIIWMHSLKHVKMLRKFGNVHYVSKKLKYVVLYCDLEASEQLAGKIASYSFVKHVEQSYKPYLKLEFESKIDKAKEYDYKMGL
ncbi:YlbG family protein [Metabacillus sp. GX 13764]|uniref:YlbG family protein n=1 Tax=Metabacillus kandeliae TaxID=2900151 RepID=UPI001E375306|nr:YlbG family protein [Metabacillus kandeliae]MCD7033918.1 YlbG family protein [Metabacillus kandeliae]